MLDRLSVDRYFVHGDIRHLEMSLILRRICISVHGDIRHLEIQIPNLLQGQLVHGDIRHLERFAFRR